MFDQPIGEGPPNPYTPIPVNGRTGPKPGY